MTAVAAATSAGRCLSRPGVRYTLPSTEGTAAVLQSPPLPEPEPLLVVVVVETRGANKLTCASRLGASLCGCGEAAAAVSLILPVAEPVRFQSARPVDREMPAIVPSTVATTITSFSLASELPSKRFRRELPLTSAR